MDTVQKASAALVPAEAPRRSIKTQSVCLGGWSCVFPALAVGKGRAPVAASATAAACS